MESWLDLYITYYKRLDNQEKRYYNGNLKKYMRLKLYNRLFIRPLLCLPTGDQFNLFITERSRIALGVLTQPKGNSQQPVDYLSKELDPVAQGWPHCLQIVASVNLLIPEAAKLVIGRDMVVYTSHAISGILNCKGGLWISDNRLLRHQSLLLEGPIIQLKTCST